MKRKCMGLKVILGLLMLVGMGVAQPFPTQAGQDKVEVQPKALSHDDYTDQIIVKYRDKALAHKAALSNESVNALSATAGVALRHSRAMAGGGHVFKLPNRMTVAEAQEIARRLTEDSTIEYAEPDRLLSPMMVPNDPQYASQWHYKAPVAPDNEQGGANLPGAWDITTGSSGIVIAVIDTGIVNHADLTGRTVPGYNFISDSAMAGNGIGRSSDPSDLGDWVTANECYSGSMAQNSSWHGTHVAGTIGAATHNGTGVAGINWVSKILPVRVLGKCGGYSSDITDGMRWAAGLSVPGVPANANPAKVMNLSLGGFGGCGLTWQSAIDDVVAAGATVVVAAGNSNADAGLFNPANCSGVITVAAISRSGGRASYSNYGTTVKIAAPGGDTSNGVLSTLNTGTTSPVASPAGDTYQYYQGTSMATPHITGISSLLLSVKPSLTPIQVQQILQDTSRAFPTGTGRDCTASLCGSGIVNAALAVQQLNGPPKIGHSPASLSFTAQQDGQNPSSQSLSISNTGGGSLSFSVSSNAAWLSLTPAGFTESGTITVSVNASSLSAGTYSGSITITAGGATNSPLTIPVTLNVVMFYEDFSGGIPGAWTIVTGGTTTYTWTTSNPGNRGIPSPFSQPWAIVDSDRAGNFTMDDQLITPSIDASSCSNVILQFDNQFFYYGNPPETADVDVSVNNGSTWTNVLTMTGASNGFPTPNTRSLNLQALAAGQSTVKIRWHYYNAQYEWWWAIDNVRVLCLPITVPDAPTGVSASAGNARAWVSFTAPANDGGSAITGYTATSNPGNVTATGAASPVSVTGLTNGTSYTFTVTATNALGTSLASAASNSVTPNMSITTTFAGGNGQNGNMFNLSATNGDVTIRKFDLNVQAVAGVSVPINVYYKNGTYVGSENNQSAWTLLGSYSVTSAGTGTATPMNVASLVIPNGQTYGLYITTTDGSYLSYTNGANAYSDVFVTITTGNGITYPFGTTFSPRTWNGTIYYTSGAGVCGAAVISPASAVYTAAGSTGSVSITAGTGCGWTAASNAGWIRVTGGASGTGNGTVSYLVSANTGPARSGTISMAGGTFTVNQAAAASGCAYALNPSSNIMTSNGGAGSVSVTAGNGCVWTAVSNAAWIPVTGGASRTGSGTVDYTVAADTGAARTGTITIAGKTFTVNQSAPAPACAYSLSRTSASLPASGGTGTVGVTAGSGCVSTAVSNAAWITVTGGARGKGNATVSYSVAANTGAARTGTVKIAGSTFTVGQSAAATCTFSISPASVSPPSSGATGSISVTTAAGCGWTVVNSNSWITVTGGPGGSGSGTVSYAIAANTGAARAGAITVAGQTFTVNQGAAGSGAADGDLDGGGVSVTDALLALRIASGIVSPTAADTAHGDVAPLVGGVPQPDGALDVGDVVVILRKVVDPASW